jgi:hypothetical protein
MIKRVTWFNLGQEIKELKEYGLIKYMNDFNRIIANKSSNYVESSFRMYEARVILEKAFIAIKNMIQPEENPYLKDFSEQYYMLIGNLGRWFKRIDTHEEDLRKKNLLGDTAITFLNLKVLVEEIKETQSSLLYYPLVRALERFNSNLEVDGGPVKKDKNLFAYFLYLELLHTSEVLGVITREPSLMSKRTGKVLNEIVAPKFPPPLPENVELEDMHTQEVDAGSFFDEPYETGEDYIHEY